MLSSLRSSSSLIIQSSRRIENPVPSSSSSFRLFVRDRNYRRRLLSSDSNGNNNSHRRKLVAGGAAAVATASSLFGIAYLNEYLGGSDGLYRTLNFYSLAIPKYLQYRMHMILDSPDHVWDELHEETSKAGLDKIMELRGFYVKSGQMAAANIGNAFPRIWQETMAPLQDSCPPRSYEVVKSIIEEDYGIKDMGEIFEYFEKTPIGAASIGQVHRATLKRDGSKVVVKVMYPGVEDVFRGDVRTIKMFCEVAQPVHVPPLIEIEKQFMTEFDYRREAEQLDRVRRNMMKANISGDKYRQCAIPMPHLDLCTKRVLVMEELRGGKLADELRRDMNTQMDRLKKSQGKLGDDERTMEGEGFARVFAHGENGPTSEQYESYIKLLDAKRRLGNAYSAMFNLSVGWMPGMTRRVYEAKSSLPINHAKLIDDLLYIHGHQILVDGCFNGDPHPGNILLLGVEEGRPQLGLIDYGQVKVLTKEERLLFCKIIVALADEDKERVCSLLKEAGYSSKYMDHDIMYKFARVGYDEDNEELTEGKHIQLFMDHLHDLDPVKEVPQQYIMASRVSILLRGLGHAVHQSRSVAKAWKPIAARVLQEEGIS